MKVGQIQYHGSSEPSRLKIHELRDDGLPRCGQPVRPFRGRRMVLVDLSRRRPQPAVNCLRCLR